MVGKVFISYRRDDDPSAAARVRDGLTARLGRSSVFMDVDNLLAGQRFDQELAKALAASDVLVAVIGVRWMDVLRSRATSGERDYVREEIAGALKRQIAVIPLRVGREGQLAQLPRPDELPEDIRELVLYQKQDVTHEHYGRDIAGLAEAVIAGRKGRRTEWSTARKAWLWLGVGAAVASLTIAAFFPALLPSSLTFIAGTGAGKKAAERAETQQLGALDARNRELEAARLAEVERQRVSTAAREGAATAERKRLADIDAQKQAEVARRQQAESEARQRQAAPEKSDSERAPDREPPLKGWGLISTKAVSLLQAERYVMPLPSTFPALSRLRITARGRAVSLQEIRITYASSDEEVIPVNARLRSEEDFSLELKGAPRKITLIKVTARGRILADSGDKAEGSIEIWAER